MDDQLLFELMNAAATLPIHGIIPSGHLHWHVHYVHQTQIDSFLYFWLLHEAGIRRC